MSVRYTAIDQMEPRRPEPIARSGELDIERWRDKLELRLDNRQVFFLFFGSAVVACMLFVLGVMVGKRIESRGQANAPDMQDPLAALDRARNTPAGTVPTDPQLTFPSTLIGAPKAPRPATPKAVVKPAVAKPAPPPVVAKPVTPAPSPTPKAVTAPADPAKSRGKFTLHLSTAATSDEADELARHYPGAFVVASDVPGRGLSYRVRYGNFASFKEATAAKEAFERDHKRIALVAAR